MMTIAMLTMMKMMMTIKMTVVVRIKMAIILPTGQWYAPSAAGLDE